MLGIPNKERYMYTCETKYLENWYSHIPSQEDYEVLPSNCIATAY